MQSPPAEWAVGIGYLAVVDYLRSRGPADGDTLSEVVREAIYRHPLGKPLGTVAFVGGAAVLYRHIFRNPT